MASVNKVILVGNVGKDPEIRYSAAGDAMCNLSLATTDKWRDKQTGEQKELTEWHRVNFFGKLAEIVGQYVTKGSPIYIEGSLRTRKWTDKDGQEKYTTEIRADQMQMLGGRNNGGGNDRGDGGYDNQPSHNQRQPDKGQHRQQPKPKPSFDDLGDDIPFS